MVHLTEKQFIMKNPIRNLPLTTSYNLKIYELLRQISVCIVSSNRAPSISTSSTPVGLLGICEDLLQLMVFRDTSSTHQKGDSGRMEYQKVNSAK